MAKALSIFRQSGAVELGDDGGGGGSFGLGMEIVGRSVGEEMVQD